MLNVFELVRVAQTPPVYDILFTDGKIVPRQVAVQQFLLHQSMQEELSLVDSGAKSCWLGIFPRSTPGQTPTIFKNFG